MQLAPTAASRSCAVRPRVARGQRMRARAVRAQVATCEAHNQKTNGCGAATAPARRECAAETGATPRRLQQRWAPTPAAARKEGGQKYWPWSYSWWRERRERRKIIRVARGEKTQSGNLHPIDCQGREGLKGKKEKMSQDFIKIFSNLIGVEMQPHCVLAGYVCVCVCCAPAPCAPPRNGTTIGSS